ncbi:MAG: hypothetical protein ABL857_02440 [Rickettsiales bacterium]|jgi:hypothetical protein
MRIREAYIVDIITAEQIIGSVQPIDEVVSSVHVSDIWKNVTPYNLTKPKEELMRDMATD